MAGMLPGVECARRRRLHQANDTPGPIVYGGSRRSSFCLYTSKHETYHTSMSSSLRNILSKASEDEKLGGVARKAKERLDGRLRSKSKELTRRQGSKMGVDQGRSTTGELQTEVFGWKSRRFNWAKLSWKAGEQDECTICLEIFKSGELLIHLPCAHRFHSKCLVPWLESNAHCPCCRLEINVDVFP